MLSSKEAISKFPDPSREEIVLLMEMGSLCVKIGRQDEALRIFQGVSALRPKSEVPLVAIANLYLSQGKAALAEKELRNAHKQVPTSAWVLVNLGETLLIRKKNTEALAVLHKAIEIDELGECAKLARELLKAHELRIFA